MEPIKPGVTQLISLLDKPALLKWANKIGLQGIKIDEYRKNATSKGINLHKEIEDFIKIGKPFTDPAIQNDWNIFTLDKEIEYSEKNIETEWYRGRIDIKLIYNGYKFICDFKSQTGVYFENKLQLTAYRMADNPDSLTKIAVIEIPKFKLNIIDIQDFKPYEDIIKALSIIYDNKLKIQTNEPFYK